MSKLVINETLQIPLDEFEFTAVRSRGPGGQNVNKVNSKVVLQWNLEASPSLPDALRGRLRRSDKKLPFKEWHLDDHQST